MSGWTAAQLKLCSAAWLTVGCGLFLPKPLRPVMFRLWAVLLQRSLVPVGPVGLWDLRQNLEEPQAATMTLLGTLNLPVREQENRWVLTTSLNLEGLREEVTFKKWWILSEFPSVNFICCWDSRVANDTKTRITFVQMEEMWTHFPSLCIHSKTLGKITLFWIWITAFAFQISN